MGESGYPGPPSPEERCTARARSTGEQCAQRAMIGRTKCRLHGGKTPRGIASPHFRTGQYSKHLPEGLKPLFNVASADPDPLNLRSELALVDTRLAQLLSQLDTKTAGPWARRLRALHKRGDEVRVRLEAAKKRGDATMVARLQEEWGTTLSEAWDLMGKGAPEWEVWGELFSVVDRRRELVEAEERRAVRLAQVLTLDQARLFMSVLVESVRRHVSEKTCNCGGYRRALAGVSEDIARIASLGGSGSTEAGADGFDNDGDVEVGAAAMVGGDEPGS